MSFTPPILKVAVIGCGSIGRHHARILSSIPDVELVALVDPVFDPMILSLLPENLYHTPIYSSLTQLLQKHNLHAAVIATPIEAHEDCAFECMQAGVHLLIEKPLAQNSTECHSLLDLASGKKCYMQVGHVERYNPAYILLKKKISENLLGPLYRIEFRRIGPFPQRMGNAGVTLDLSIHDLDLVLDLAESLPHKIFALSEKRIHKSHEDGIWISLDFPQGLQAYLQANWLSPRKQRTLEVYGLHGMLRCDLFGQTLVYYENKHTRNQPDSFGLDGIEPGEETNIPIHTSEPLQIELQDWVEKIKEFSNFSPEQKSLPQPKNIQAARAVRLCEKALQSAKLQQVIPLHWPETP